MNNTSLDQVGSRAKSFYYEHKIDHEYITNDEDALKAAKRERRRSHSKMPSQEEESLEEILSENKTKYAEHVGEAKKFAEDNAEQLHDLAVIEAHLGGVAIQVEQPLSTTETVEIHRS